MYTRPLFSHENFCSRKDEIKNLTESLKHSLPQQILLTGCKGVGKTYLLKKVMSEMKPDIICIYIDLKRIRACNDELTIEMIFIELLKEITGLRGKFELKKEDFHKIFDINSIMYWKYNDLRKRQRQLI